MTHKLECDIKKNTIMKYDETHILSQNTEDSYFSLSFTNTVSLHRLVFIDPRIPCKTIETIKRYVECDKFYNKYSQLEYYIDCHIDNLLCNKTYISPPCIINGRKLQMKMFHIKEDKTDYLGVFLVSADHVDPEIKNPSDFTCSFTILFADSKWEQSEIYKESKKQTHKFCKKEQDWGYLKCFKVSDAIECSNHGVFKIVILLHNVEKP